MPMKDSPTTVDPAITMNYGRFALREPVSAIVFILPLSTMSGLVLAFVLRWLDQLFGMQVLPSLILICSVTIPLVFMFLALSLVLPAVRNAILIWRECNSGNVRRIEVRNAKAFIGATAGMGFSVEGYLVEGTDQNLLLLGSWCIEYPRSEDGKRERQIFWDFKDGKRNFPSANFDVVYLPGSGRVLGVEVIGPPIFRRKDDESGPVEIFLDEVKVNRCGFYHEIQIVEGDIR